MRRLSQVFLNSDEIAEKIAAAIPLRGKTVLEIGAGTGILTRALAKRAKRVVAIEIDAKLARSLAESAPKNVEVIHADALAFNSAGFDTVFGNLPYHLSSPLLFRILESDFEKAVVMLQKEFALRLVAEPDEDDYSRLTVMAQAKADVELLGEVTREHFDPQPQVDSILVLLKRKTKPVPLDADLVNALFQHKNQTVRNAFEHSAYALGKDKDELRAFANSLEVKDRRVRSLSLDELAWLGKKFRGSS